MHFFFAVLHLFLTPSSVSGISESRKITDDRNMNSRLKLEDSQIPSRQSNRLSYSNFSSSSSRSCEGALIKDKKYSHERSYVKIEEIFDEPNKTCIIPSGRPPLGPSGSDLCRRRREGSRISCKHSADI